MVFGEWCSARYQDRVALVEIYGVIVQRQLTYRRAGRHNHGTGGDQSRRTIVQPRFADSPTGNRQPGFLSPPHVLWRQPWDTAIPIAGILGVGRTTIHDLGDRA